MKNCAFLSLDQRGDFVIDDDCAIEPLANIGWNVETLSWRRKDVRWDAFDAVVIRSTWDYWNDVADFLETLALIARRVPLANSLDLVHWNLAKTYLRDLEGKGVRVVPSLWLDDFHVASAGDWSRRLGSEGLVVKPTVGANGEDAFRFTAEDAADRLQAIADRFRGRACMVQPFLHGVLEEGEYSLFFFGGVYSHAILKVPAAGEFRSQEERGAAIHPVTPEPALLDCGRQAMAAVSPAPLYARVDLVRTPDGEFAVMELELIEPSLYLRTDPGAPGRFARALDAWFAAA